MRFTTATVALTCASIGASAGVSNTISEAHLRTLLQRSTEDAEVAFFDDAATGEEAINDVLLVAREEFALGL